MRSALKIIAFSNSTKFDGIVALLETALEALDDTGQFRAAAYVDMALNAYVSPPFPVNPLSGVYL